MCLMFFLTPGLPCDVPRGPLRASLLHPSGERPSAEVAEAGEERGSCGSGNYRIFGVEQQVTVRVWIRAGHLQSYTGVCGSAGGLSCILE